RHDRILQPLRRRGELREEGAILPPRAVVERAGDDRTTLAVDREAVQGVLVDAVPRERAAVLARRVAEPRGGRAVEAPGGQHVPGRPGELHEGDVVAGAGVAELAAGDDVAGGRGGDRECP